MLRALAEESRREPGCVVYVPHRIERPSGYGLTIEQ